MLEPELALIGVDYRPLERRGRRYCGGCQCGGVACQPDAHIVRLVQSIGAVVEEPQLGNDKRGIPNRELVTPGDSLELRVYCIVPDQS